MILLLLAIFYFICYFFTLDHIALAKMYINFSLKNRQLLLIAIQVALKKVSKKILNK